MKKYDLSYDPTVYSHFESCEELDYLLHYMFSVDKLRGSFPERYCGNVFFLRGEEGHLEYYCRVDSPSERQRLRDIVSNHISSIPLQSLRSDVAYFRPLIGRNELLEVFAEFCEEKLPAVWKEKCPVQGIEDSFLDNTSCMVLIRNTAEYFPYRIIRLYKAV